MDMKDLNQYRDEIFRRSAEKKRQIRKRRRIALGVGIPLCLCCVLTVTLLPGTFAKKDFAPNMSVMANDAESCEKPETGPKVFDVTDPQTVSDVLNILEGDYLQKENLSGSKHETADQVDGGYYRFTLELTDGSILSYQINGLDVYCETNSQIQTLSPAEAQALYDLLTESKQEELS